MPIQENKATLKITNIIVELSGIDKDGKDVRTTLTRGPDFAWHITGDCVLYPRHLRFMNELNERAREVDGLTNA